MPYKFWSVTKPPYPCVYVPISSIPFIETIRNDWDKLLNKQNVIRAYFTYRIMHIDYPPGTVTLPIALAKAREACAKAHLEPHGTDIYDEGLHWTDIWTLLW